MLRWSPIPGSFKHEGMWGIHPFPQAPTSSPGWICSHFNFSQPLLVMAATSSHASPCNHYVICSTLHTPRLYLEAKHLYFFSLKRRIAVNSDDCTFILNYATIVVKYQTILRTAVSPQFTKKELISPQWRAAKIFTAGSVVSRDFYMMMSENALCSNRKPPVCEAAQHTQT